VRDRVLTALLILIVILNVGHTVDHAARGDLQWAPTAESLTSIIVTLAIYGILGLGLYLHFNDRVGPRFWTILGGLGVAFGWLAHFSPFTSQPPHHILHAYRSPAVGALALGWLITLMLVLIVTTIYAGYRWARTGTP